MLGALFLSALLSATLLPGGSEALLIYQLHQGEHAWLLILIAGCGNVLGSIITYGIGYGGNQLLYHHPIGHKFAPSPQRMEQGKQLFSRWGYPSLLFAWLPIVGDPITLVAGVLRIPLTWFVILVSIGKFSRYTALTLITQ
ncbi:MAG: YqaA family protein [Mariprofundales bacterium]